MAVAGPKDLAKKEKGAFGRVYSGQINIADALINMPVNMKWSFSGGFGSLALQPGAVCRSSVGDLEG